MPPLHFATYFRSLNHIPVFLNFLGTVYILHKGSIYEIRVVKVHLNIERKITLHGVILGNCTSLSDAELLF